MTHRSLAALILINAVLLVALAFTALSPSPVHAQFGAAPSYTMISGDVTGLSNQAGVYVIDLNSGRIVSLVYNASNNKLEILGNRDVSRDMQSVNERR